MKCFSLVALIVGINANVTKNIYNTPLTVGVKEQLDFGEKINETI